jgi:glycosyltransferase involved in cell wall biosynthesis
VSVVIPVYNRARYLERAVASVLAGHYRDFEILVVDGGSTDGTVEAAEDFARRGAPVRVLHNPARVVAASLNVGLRAARGKYVAQLDSDDEYTPSTLSQSVAYLEAYPDCALAISYYDFIDDAGWPLEDLGVVRHLEYDRNAILRTNGAGAVRVWHRCVLERLGGFREECFPDYAEDYDMILRLCERYAVGRVPDVLYRCRLHASNSDQRLSLEDRASKKALARAQALARRTALLNGVSGLEGGGRD